MFGRALGFAISMLLLNSSDYDDDIKKERFELEKRKQKEQLELELYKEGLMNEVRKIQLVQPTYN